MNTSELLLIDLSAIAHQIFHVSGSEPDPSFVSNAIIARVRSLASEHPYAAICCDAGKSFRVDIDPQYKANRDTEDRAVLRHQIDDALDVLRADGFPVWRVPGFEADDLIATAVAQAIAIDGATVLIASADKDMTQLVSNRVSMKKITDGSIVGPAEVLAKFKVNPSIMHDFLCLVGDVSDNIIGARGIGGVTAAKLLNAHGSIAAIYEAMTRGVVKDLTPALRTSMQEFHARWAVVSQLVTLRTDVEIPFAEIAAERVSKPMVEDTDMEQEILGPDSFGGEDTPHSPAAETLRAEIQGRDLDQNESLSALSGGAVEQVKERVAQSPPYDAAKDRAQQEHIARTTGIEARGNVGAVMPYAAHVDFSQQLEPRNMTEAIQLAQRVFDSRLFGAYGTPQGVLTTILAGRDHGLSAMQSLHAYHIINGKPSPSADMLAGLVMCSGKCKYFRCTERTETHAKFVTQRLPVDSYPENSLTFTIEQARKAWDKDERAWNNSNYVKRPESQLVARAKSALARLEYPDVVGGMYSAEEMD